jgi:replicative DNA helicase
MKEKKLKYSSLAVLPNNFFAEQSILNILLTNPLLIKKIVGKLKVESFYFEPHRIIYASLVDLEAENQEITLTTLITRLQDESLLSSIGGLERIVTIENVIF